MGVNNMENVAFLEITKYQFKVIDGQPKIVVSMVKALDSDGKYIKFLSMKESLPLLSELPVTFKPQVA